MERSTPLLVLDAAQVRSGLDYRGCMAVVREAMIALSEGRTRQLLRTMIGLGDDRLFAVMPGALGDQDPFGAKLISVFGDPGRAGRRVHRGLVALFDPETGIPVCVADAEEITLIRTAAMSAVATDALARPDAAILALFGCGPQATTHLRAIAAVRPLAEVRIWGRSFERAHAVATALAAETGLAVRAVRAGCEAARGADIVCTLTGAQEPILFGEWIDPGTHLNLVGSSGPGAVEVDRSLVVGSRFVADSRLSITTQGGEFLRAKHSGAIGDDHIVAEIGEVLNGTIPGRRTMQEVTLFKSIGHAVQDLAAATYLWRKATS